MSEIFPLILSKTWSKISFNEKSLVNPLLSKYIFIPPSIFSSVFTVTFLLLPTIFSIISLSFGEQYMVTFSSLISLISLLIMFSIASLYSLVLTTSPIFPKTLS
uniref:Uncharacterized protein ORF-c21_038 n=1 Tax=Saccharolobus solfataricus TaxID=2287 RepID=Q9UWW4_SACSO|nr:hypothetical protein [Saccharolobus solfataricus P2]